MRKLTRDESRALSMPYNLADAHTRYSPSDHERSRTIDRLTDIYNEAAALPQHVIDRRGFEAFLTLGGQVTAAQTHTFLPTYSASVAMEIVAVVLAKRTKVIALTHPTFDNIADILKRHEVHLIPLEDSLTGPQWRQSIAQLKAAGVGAVVLVTPNNPTGKVIRAKQLRDIGVLCAEEHMPLVLDCSFRLYDDEATYDHCGVLEGTGAEYIVIEDTGKIWPTQDIKLSYIVPSSHILRDLQDVYDDLILNVSPFASNLIYHLSLLSSSHQRHSFRHVIQQNRLLLRNSLPRIGVSFPYRSSRISVEILDFVTEERAQILLESLRSEGVTVLSGRAFHWHSPHEGAKQLRIALARDPAYFAEAVGIMANVVSLGG